MLDDLVQLHRAGRLDEAENGYRKWLADHPDDARALHLLGIVRGQRGDLPEALRLVQRAGDLDPENATCRHTLGEMYLSEGKLEEAMQAYDEARRLNPNLSAAHTGLGKVAMRRGAVDAAEDHFKTALRADANDVQALAGLGRIAQMRGDSTRALQWLAQAGDLAPDDPHIQATWARTLLDQGRFDFAAKAVDNALSVKPDFPQALVLRAELYVRRGEAARALPVYESLLARGEQIGQVRAGLGDIARAEGRPDAALAQYEEALRIEPGLDAAASARAAILAERGRTPQAIEDLQAHLQRHPDSPRAHAELAGLLAGAGRHAEAEAAWKAAQARWPDDVDLKARHALMLDRSGHFAEALVLADAAAASPRPALVLLRARGALLAGDAAAAVQRLKRIEPDALQGKPPRLARRRQRLLGLAFDALGQWEDAVAAFQSAHQLRASAPPELPLLDAPARAWLQRAADAPELVESRGPAPILLCGLPGSGVAQVAALLADHTGMLVRRERFDAPPDFASAPFDPRLLDPLNQSDLALLARRYRRPLERAGVPADVRVVDWFPVLDARVVPALKRALPGTRLVIAERAPHDALLNWLGFGWAERLTVPDPSGGARWLVLAAAHLELAGSMLPCLRVDPDALLATDGGGARTRLAAFLGIAALAPGEMARRAAHGPGGLPVHFLPGHAVHYRQVLSRAFAVLDGGGDQHVI